MDAAQWDARYAQADLVWKAEPNQWVRQHTAELASGSALDLACGEGRNAVWLADRGWRVTAVDFSAVAIDKGRRRAEAGGPRLATRIDWRVADVTDYVPDGCFDLVMAIYLQLPAAQRRAALRIAARAVAPGGRLLVVAHHSDNRERGVGGPPDPAVLYTERDVLSDVVEVSRLRPVTAERVERFVEGADRPALDLVVELVDHGEPRVATG